MQLSLAQQDIINAPYNRIVVMASAASGKTTLMTEKVRSLLRNNVDPRQIAVITFTNLAASELRGRLGNDYKPGLYVGTIHSLANQLLNIAGISTSSILNKEQFDKLFELVKKNPHCVKHYEWVLLDEAQDSDEHQFEFIFDMINPDCFFVCGDVKQSIYQWNGAKPKLLKALAARPDVHSFDLLENYRNSIRILEDARRIIQRSGEIDNSIPMRQVMGIDEQIRLDDYDIISRIEARPPYNQWAILCRWNKDVDRFSATLSETGISYETFKQARMTKDDMDERMNRDTVKILTVHSAKGLEWNNVMVYGTMFNNYHSDDEINISYVAATRARNNLFWISNKQKRRTYF